MLNLRDLHLIYVDQVLVEEIDYGDEDSVKQATDLLLQKELVSEVGFLMSRDQP